PGHCPKCGMKLLATAAPTTAYACPIHPEVVSDTPGRCPKCGMKLLPSQLVAPAADLEASHGHHDAGSEHGAGDGTEWEDDMVEINRITTPANMRWKLVDRDTGAENHGIDWQFTVGDQVK